MRVVRRLPIRWFRAGERMHREYPVTYAANGELYEGVDFVWLMARVDCPRLQDRPGR
jgi:hypothetical protein